MINFKSCCVPVIFIALAVGQNVKNKTMMPFIVGGNFTKIINFPHAVFLAAECDEANFICGGSILNQKIVVTAAHCVAFTCNKELQLYIFAGHEDHEKALVVRKVDSFTMHDEYDQDEFYNDIALVYINRSIPLIDTIKRVILKKNFSNKEKYGLVAGWGVINDTTMLSIPQLKMVKQDLVAWSDCNKIARLVPGTMCAGSLEKIVKDRPSSGDSGSGLVLKSAQLIGLVSFRIPTHEGLVMYADVSHYYDWIQEKAILYYCELTNWE